MKSSKLLLGIFILLISLSVATASEIYDIKMDIYPKNPDSEELIIGEDEDFLVFGYIYVKDDLNAKEIDELKIQVLDKEGNIESTYVPTYVDKSSDSYLFEGYFYEEIDIRNEGEYVIRAKINSSGKEFKIVKVEDLENRDLELNLIDYSINKGNLKIGLTIENKDSTERDVRIEIKGENNFENPRYLNVEVDSDESKTIEVDFELEDFGNSKFLISAQAYSGDLISNADYLNINGKESNNDYHKEDLKITDISLNKDILFSGDVVEGTAFVKNKGTTKTQYKFEFVYDNQVFKSSDTKFVEPGQTAEQEFFLEIPEQEKIDLNFKVYNEYAASEFEKTFLISTRTKDFIFSVEQLENIDANETKTIDINLINRGNQKDVYTLSFEGWENFEVEKNIFKVKPSTAKEIPLNISVPNETRVGEYNLNVTICNTEEKCKTKTLDFKVIKPEKEQTVTEWKEEQSNIVFSEVNESIELDFNVTNIGAEEKEYLIGVESEEGENIAINLTNPEFSLDVNETKEVSFKLTPLNRTNYTLNLILSADGKNIFEKEINLVPTEKAGGITGMFIAKTNGIYLPGVISLVLAASAIVGYFVYRHISDYRWRENVLKYTEEHPRQLTK